MVFTISLCPKIFHSFLLPLPKSLLLSPHHHLHPVTATIICHFIPLSTIFININATIHHCLNCHYTTIPLTLSLLLSPHHLWHCHNHFCHHLCHHIHEHHMSRKYYWFSMQTKWHKLFLGSFFWVKTKHKKINHFLKNVFQVKIFSPKQTEY